MCIRDSFIAILGMFGSGNNHFRISVSNLKQRRAFSLKCFLPGNVVADLNIDVYKRQVSWVCILGAAPFAALGFVKYNGMTDVYKRQR